MHQQHSFGSGVGHGLVHLGFAGRVALAKAHVDDLGAVVHRIVDAVGHVFVVLVAVGHDAYGHDAGRRTNAVQANAVGVFGANDAGDVGAVGGVRAFYPGTTVIALGEVGGVVADDGAVVKVQVVCVVDGRGEMGAGALQIIDDPALHHVNHKAAQVRDHLVFGVDGFEVGHGVVVATEVLLEYGLGKGDDAFELLKQLVLLLGPFHTTHVLFGHLVVAGFVGLHVWGDLQAALVFELGAQVFVDARELEVGVVQVSTF